jgi:catechol 2,3-dioxygenase
MVLKDKSSEDNNTSSFVIDPSARIGHVHLRVSDMKESIMFYQSILGFRVIEEKTNSKAIYLTCEMDSTSPNKKRDKVSPLLVLSQATKDNRHDDPIQRGKTGRRANAGLYHFAILLPGRKYLSAFLRHIQEKMDPQLYEGSADHSVSESIYIHDPDNNGIEIYRDRPSLEWERNGGKVHMVTERLNTQGLLYQYPFEEWEGLPYGTTIGHVHLHVSDLNGSLKFIRDGLGLHHTASYPGAYFFAADGYHHHIATNTWLGTNIKPNDIGDEPGLDHYAIRIPNDNWQIKRMRERFGNLKIPVIESTEEEDKQHPESLYVYDPDRIKIQFLSD